MGGKNWEQKRALDSKKIMRQDVERTERLALLAVADPTQAEV